jgi:hypothetical protein
LATTRPRASAAQRSRLASLSASLRSGPGGMTRASSRASTARVSQSYLPVERCVSLLITAQFSRSRDPFRIFSSKTPIFAALFPAPIYSAPYRRPSSSRQEPVDSRRAFPQSMFDGRSSRARHGDVIQSRKFWMREKRPAQSGNKCPSRAWLRHFLEVKPVEGYWQIDRSWDC